MQGVPLDNHTKNQAVALLADGQTQMGTARTLGLDPSTINKLAKREKVAVNELALQLAAKSRQHVLNLHVNTLKLADKVIASEDLEQIEKCKTLLTLADKKEYRALTMMGIVPSHTQGTLIQIFQDNRTQVLDPVMAQSFKADAIRFNDDEAEDAEYTEEPV